MGMIILIEPQCVGWQHESVNAGFIESIKRNVGEETVKVYAERGHIHCLRQLLPDMEKKIVFQAIEVPQKKLDWTSPWPIYYRLFRKILCDADNANVRVVFLLSCNKGNLVAIRKMAAVCKQTQFCIVMHAIAEQLINKARVPRHTILSLKCILDTFSARKNVKFITYSPVAREVLANVLKKKILDKVIFLHHPFPTWEQEMQDVKEDGKIHIAIVGAGVRKDVHDFIKSIDREITGKIVFDIMDRSEIDFTDLKNVGIMKKDEDITNAEIAQLIKRSHFVFLPYTQKEYRVSCSGILIDAIRQAVPILAFDSSLLVWYNQYHIGKVCSSYDEMQNYLRRLCDDQSDQWLEYQQNISVLRQRILDENDEKMWRLCGGVCSE